MRLIAFFGPKKSGKDECATMLRELFVDRLCGGDPLRRFTVEDVRGGLDFCQWANTGFQEKAARGAKRAIILMFRACRFVKGMASVCRTPVKAEGKILRERLAK